MISRSIAKETSIHHKPVQVSFLLYRPEKESCSREAATLNAQVNTASKCSCGFAVSLQTPVFFPPGHLVRHFPLEATGVACIPNFCCSFLIFFKVTSIFGREWKQQPPRGDTSRFLCTSTVSFFFFCMVFLHWGWFVWSKKIFIIC